MSYIEWKDNTVPHFNILEMYKIDDLFDTKKIEIDFHPDLNKLESNFLCDWMSSKSELNFILTDKKVHKHYYIEGCVALFIYNNSEGIVSTCKMKIGNIKEITRELKINNILK
jgi:hypothetical protein